MAIAAFVLSIIAILIFVVLIVVFIWFGAMVNKQETIEKTTREFLEQKYNKENNTKN